MKDRLILQKRMNFDLFKSEICHILKNAGDYKFIEEIITDNWVEYFYNKGWFAECMYTLAMVDYLTYCYDAPVYAPLDKYRQYKLEKMIFPFSITLMDNINGNNNEKQKAIEECKNDECGRFFYRCNIIEKSIRDVV